ESGPWESVDFKPTSTCKLVTMDVSPTNPVNHHADHPGVAGPMGVFIALIILLVGRTRSRLVADLASLSSSDHVVDIGCGPGNSVRAAARYGARVTGV